MTAFLYQRSAMAMALPGARAVTDGATSTSQATSIDFLQWIVDETVQQQRELAALGRVAGLIKRTSVSVAGPAGAAHATPNHSALIRMFRHWISTPCD